MVFGIGTVSETFLRLELEKKGLFLKLDFVNDVKFHWGDFERKPQFHKIDNWRNILSNKLCALSRMDVKDIVDIVFIASRFKFTWHELFKEAKEKDLWVDPLEICKIIKAFPKELWETIKWVSPISTEQLNNAVQTLHNDIFWGRNNSLVETKIRIN